MKDQKVKIYTHPSCKYCKIAVNYLQKHDVDYEQYDVAEDYNARQEMAEKSHQLGVPVIEFDDEIFVGFHRKEIARKLGVEEHEEN